MLNPTDLCPRECFESLAKLLYGQEGNNPCELREGLPYCLPFVLGHSTTNLRSHPVPRTLRITRISSPVPKKLSKYILQRGQRLGVVFSKPHSYAWME